VFQEKSWRWITGEKFEFTSWGTGQPDNAGNAEHYLHFWAENGNRWNDAIHNGPHSQPLGYICEWDPPYEGLRKEED
jgi:hypothetical protein